MKKVIVILIVSALLSASACSLETKPNFSVCQKSRGTVVYDENEFEAEFDCSGAQVCVILKAKQNAFSTRYLFGSDTVTLIYDDIQTKLDINALPDTNTALLFYRMLQVLSDENTKWTHEAKQYNFESKIHEVHCSGCCAQNGKVISFEVPEYRFYYKADV